VLSDKEKCDVLLGLAESSWREFDTRRAFEWKVSFGLWTALGLLALSLGRADLRLDVAGKLAVTLCLLALVVVYVFVWSWGIYRSHTKNQEAVRCYCGLVEDVLGITTPRRLPPDKRCFWAKTPRQRPPDKHSFWVNWSLMSQISATVLLAVIVGWMLWVSSGPHAQVDSNSKCVTIVNQ
jgi:hypothetical protein